MNKKYSLYSKHSVMALAVASSLSLTPMWADAAGLGRITVYSALGQPLRAEVQVTATGDELPGMLARLAPVESFRQAGVDYSSSLSQLRFAVEKRSGGAVIKVSSDKPINDPFLDFLLELNWPSGRLVREYTFLLDPPEVAAQASRRQATVEARTVPALAAGSEQGETLARAEKQAPAKVVEKSADKPVPEARPVSSKPAPTPAPAAASNGQHVVKPGETLRRIASENLPAGVSLEQMLVALYRNNSDAFAGNNMNRLQAGVVLQMPTQAEAEAIPESEARKVFRAQASDWNSYRRKLAIAAETAPVAKAEGSRSASGKVSANVEEKLAPAEQSRDQVKVSRSTQAAGKAAGAEEELIAKGRALKESQERLVMLEKNVAELQKLLELKNQNLAEMQKQLAKPAPAAAQPPAMPVAVVPEPKAEVKAEPKPEPKLESKPALPVEPVAAKDATPVEPPAKPAEEAVKPVEPPAPPAPKPVAPKTPVAPPPPVEEPGFLDGMDTLPLIGGGGLLAALLGYLFYRRRRSGQGELDSLSQEMPDPTPTMSANSVFQTAGGRNVDTANTSPPTTDFSQAGPGAIDTDEVDPVAEADVYMAYGRDAQAEEILLDALQKDPQRTAIHAKLLEIYANRKGVKQFETLATELYAQTGGQGAEWEKVAALGRNLDPANPLYGSTGAAVAVAAVAAVAAPAFDAEATLVVNSTDALAALTPTPAPDAAPAAMPEADIDFDFASDAKAMSESVASQPEVAAAPDLDVGVLDFDLGSEASAKPAEQAESFVETIAGLELGAGTLDFDLDNSAAEEAKPAAAPVEAAADLGSAMDFPEVAVSPAAALETLDFDLDLQSSGFSLDEAPAESGLSLTANNEDLLSVDLAAAPVSEVPAAELGGGLLDFELHVPSDEAPADKSAAQITAASLESDMEFDLNLDDSTALGEPLSAGVDLSGIDLELGGGAMASAEAPAAEPFDPRRDEVNTKLDLAKAYEDMGDLEGARELLGEVLSEGAPDQVEQARANLDRLSA